MEIIIFKQQNQRLNISCQVVVFVFAFFKVLSFGIFGGLYV